MLKAYAFGLFSASLAVLLVAAIWIGTQPKQQEGLLWGDTVYTSKQEFNGYLKSKGLSYKAWLARYPDAAPWEPDEINVGAITVRAPRTVVQLLLAGIAWLLATLGALLLLRRERPGLPGWAEGSAALFTAVLAGALVVGIWFSTESTQKPGLSWGGTVYTSKADFSAHLRSRGSSYEAWLARHPGVAPWEPAVTRSRTSAQVTRAPEAANAHSGGRSWPLWPFLIGIGLLLMALVAGLLPLGGRRPVLARLTAAPNGPSRSEALLFLENGSARPKMAAFLEHVGVAASAGAARLRVWAPRYSERVVVGSRISARLVGEAARESSRVLAIAAREISQAVGVAARESARVLGASAQESARVVASAGRAGSSRLAQSMREREVGPGEMAVALFAVVSAVAIGVVVVFALSSM